MTTLIDEKLKVYGALQTGQLQSNIIKEFFSHTIYVSIEIQKLFVSKQQVLSQFNENTLVKGVSWMVHCDSFNVMIWF